MKLIEALKKTKDLERKLEDLRQKIGVHCAISSLQSPTYPDQKAKVEGWVQSHTDILKEILRLRIAIQRTNLETEVTIEFPDESATKSIAEWIHRRRSHANTERLAWERLTDRNMKEGFGDTPAGDKVEIKIVRFFIPDERDTMIDKLSSEPSIIDGRLEVVNAITDLIE
jgi:hypothetical protein